MGHYYSYLCRGCCFAVQNTVGVRYGQNVGWFVACCRYAPALPGFAVAFVVVAGYSYRVACRYCLAAPVADGYSLAVSAADGLY